MRAPTQLQDRTADLLLQRLLRGPSTAAALARELDVDVAAARRHLEEHLRQGHVAAAFRQEGVGRPRKYFELTSAGRERLPRRYDLLSELLVASLAHESADTAGRIADRAAERVVAELAPRLPAKGDVRQRARGLASALREMGFPTELEVHADRIVLRRRDCIFLQAARQHPGLLCRRFDARLVEVALGQPAELERCLPEGASCCEHVLRTG